MEEEEAEYGNQIWIVVTEGKSEKGGSERDAMFMESEKR